MAATIAALMSVAGLAGLVSEHRNNQAELLAHLDATIYELEQTRQELAVTELELELARLQRELGANERALAVAEAAAAAATTEAERVAAQRDVARYKARLPRLRDTTGSWGMLAQECVLGSPTSGDQAPGKQHVIACASSSR